MTRNEIGDCSKNVNQFSTIVYRKRNYHKVAHFLSRDNVATEVVSCLFSCCCTLSLTNKTKTEDMTGTVKIHSTIGIK